MFYITKYNYYKNIICKLDIDIPAIEKTGFFNNYKLDLFDLDLSYFTKNEREALIISDHLFRNISNINKNMIFKQIKRAESQWVYKLSVPAYHADRYCPNLEKEFNNIRIPSSLNPTQAKEYRQFFIDNKDRYGNKAGLIEPRVFARKLKEKFNLNENLDELLENHILPEIRENSGVECINITLEQFIGEINELINIFKNFIREEQVSASFSAGLDPYIGFYHALDFGRESLACDLIEPLRPLIDNWCLGLFRQNILREESFSTTQEGCFLGKAGRVQFYKSYESAVGNWRKMLTENSLDIVNLIKQADFISSPQRRESEWQTFSNLNEKQWQGLLGRYYFNQQTMLQDVIFQF